MRILVDSGDYTCGNLGDVAMLQMAVSRLFALWPTASIQVLHDNAERLTRYCPSVTTLSCIGRREWSSDRNILGRLHYSVPAPVSAQLIEWKRMLRWKEPGYLHRLLRHRLSSPESAAVDHFHSVVEGSDLIVLAGAGGLTDHASPWWRGVLDLVDLAFHYGRPVAMFSQGIGPVTNPSLKGRLRTIVPRLHLLALREKACSLRTLESCGVSAGDALITGDDAIELAYERRPLQLGDGLGISLRVSRSSQVTEDQLTIIGTVLRDLLNEFDAPVVSIPIEPQSDGTAIQKLMSNPQYAANDPLVDSPLDCIRCAGNCRLVITGAYHAAVFALSQGIPAVCLGKSDYYRQKLLGLVAQFGAGCAYIDIDTPDFSSRLRNLSRDLWRDADLLRPQLLAASLRQIDAGHAAYRALRELFPASQSCPDRTLISA